MDCIKCNGRMVHDNFYDKDGYEFVGIRCINCGIVLDPVILSNRGKQLTPTEVNNG